MNFCLGSCALSWYLLCDATGRTQGGRVPTQKQAWVWDWTNQSLVWGIRVESGSETYIINIQFQVPANPRIAFTVRRTEVEPASHVHFMSTFSSAKPIAIIWPEGRGLKQKWRSVSVCVCVRNVLMRRFPHAATWLSQTASHETFKFSETSANLQACTAKISMLFAI